ncbi:hypothetical protein Ciccas_013768 [Cichlidogyrus casuarinus]|uniref:Uncharacterized protein n=1 Tax=Cichlidogyrus casuarinus TaxID=1844966 RepID=A0ABD2PJR4_9PLAT
MMRCVFMMMGMALLFSLSIPETEQTAILGGGMETSPDEDYVLIPRRIFAKRIMWSPSLRYGK